MRDATMSLVQLVWLLSFVTTTLCIDIVTTRTRYGEVMGMRALSTHDTGGETSIVDQYLGVPYAAPPVGKLRFQPPNKPLHWSGTMDCTHARSVCIQSPEPYFHPVTSVENQAEDCLYLNIYAPYQKVTRSSPYPVMVFIHGGSYVVGTGNMYDGSLLAQHGVVVVTFNYRLGVLGFFSTGSSEIPGNYGFLDQIEALRWVQQNIRAFRGDPSNVTIFGNSVGGASVGLHMVSPLSKGLFHRVIAQSGSALSSYAIMNRGTDLSSSWRSIASACGCKTNVGEYDLLQCMRSLPAGRMRQDPHLYSINDDPVVMVTMPRIDGHVFTETPFTSFTSGSYRDVPFMTGIVSDEWSINMGWMIENLKSHSSKHIDGDFSDGLDRETFEEAVIHVVTVVHKLPQTVADFVLYCYTDWSNVTDPLTNRKQYVQFITDVLFLAPTIHLADILSTTSISPVYVYEFSYLSTVPYPDSRSWMGVYHSSELNYVFGSPYTGQCVDIVYTHNYSTADKIMSTDVMKTWTAFAKGGAERTITQTTNTTHLHPYNVHSQKYLSFGNDAVSVKSHLRAQQVALWNDLVPKYKRAGTDKPCDWVAIGLSILTAALAICFVIITVYCCTKNNQRTLPIKNHNQST